MENEKSGERVVSPDDLSGSSRVRVVRMREGIAGGRYNFEGRLSVVLDRLIREGERDGK